MTKKDIQVSINEMVNSKAWNYILIGSAIITFIVATRNIYLYTKKIAEERGE